MTVCCTRPSSPPECFRAVWSDCPGRLRGAPGRLERGPCAIRLGMQGVILSPLVGGRSSQRDVKREVAVSGGDRTTPVFIEAVRIRCVEKTRYMWGDPFSFPAGANMDGSREWGRPAVDGKLLGIPGLGRTLLLRPLDLDRAHGSLLLVTAPKKKTAMGDTTA